MYNLKKKGMLYEQAPAALSPGGGMDGTRAQPLLPLSSASLASLQTEHVIRSPYDG